MEDSYLNNLPVKQIWKKAQHRTGEHRAVHARSVRPQCALAEHVFHFIRVAKDILPYLKYIYCSC